MNKRGEVFDWICVPVASDKKDPALTVQRLKKRIDQPGDFLCCDFILDGERRWDAIRDLVQSSIVYTVSFFSGIPVIFFEREIPHDTANVA